MAYRVSFTSASLPNVVFHDEEESSSVFFPNPVPQEEKVNASASLPNLALQDKEGSPLVELESKEGQLERTLSSIEIISEKEVDIRIDYNFYRMHFESVQSIYIRYNTRLVAREVDLVAKEIIGIGLFDKDCFFSPTSISASEKIYITADQVIIGNLVLKRLPKVAKIDCRRLTLLETVKPNEELHKTLISWLTRGDTIVELRKKNSYCILS